MIKAYLAGPDVFLPDAAAHAARRVAICRAHGIEALPPLAEDASDPAALYRHCVALMEQADIVIANLTPFRGASADAGTLVELGWFLGRGRPIFGYSNDRTDYETRTRRLLARSPDPLPGLAVEGFGLPDNLMIPGAVATGPSPILLPEPGEIVPFDGLAVFTRCAAAAAAWMV